MDDREEVNENIAYLLERYLDMDKYKGKSEVVREAAEKMKDVYLLGLWYLTQEFLR